jgi:HK97 family phage portal protein
VISPGDSFSVSYAGAPEALARNAVPSPVSTVNPRFLWHREEPSSGEKVSQDDALGIDTVFSCCNVLSQSIASLPLDLYRISRKKGQETTEKARNHRLFNAIKRRPHPEMTSFRWRQFMMVEVLLRGNSISQILRDDSGSVTGIYPLLWDRATMKRRESGEIAYEYAVGKTRVVLDKSEVLHIRGISNSGGLVGMSIIESLRESFGLTRAIEKHGGKTFANGAAPSGVLEVPEELSDEAYERLKSSWNARQQGASASGYRSTAILEGGTKFSGLSMSNEDAQFLETRKYQRSQIASFFSMPPHLVGDFEHATFSNIEEMGRSFVQHTLRPWFENIEQELDLLLTEKERETMYFRHNAEALQRGNFAAMTQGIGTLINSAVMTPNEARSKFEMNAHPDGDVLLGNGTLVPISTAGQEPQQDQPQQ